jgi:hypothetical protein
MVDKGHLNFKGLLQIVGLKALFKGGLSKLLLKAFPQFVPVLVPTYSPQLNLMTIT